jgi:hypothetical protein
VSRVDLTPFVRHAVLFGDECVAETAREMFTAQANTMRRELPPPADLTWLPEVERERLIDERVQARAAFRAEIIETKNALDRLPAEIALARRKARKKATPQKRRRPTTAPMRTQVLELYERGLILAAIADTLNVSDRRVQEILRDAGYRRNGHGKRLVQAMKAAETPLVEVV